MEEDRIFKRAASASREDRSRMPKVRVRNFSVSLDGYAAGPGQDVANPLGVGGERLHDWAFGTRTFQEMFGGGGGGVGVDERFAAAGREGIGATIMGRNMFGPVRGDWQNEDWTGWWGDNPPYHHEVFVLTHHPRQSFRMDGGTTFHFVTDGIESALDRAVTAANGQDVLIAGGAATIQQYLAAGLIDELHLAFVPVLLGGGERLFDQLGDGPIGYDVAELVQGEAAVHIRLVRRQE
jgi:dihydrofolate reductase